MQPSMFNLRVPIARTAGETEGPDDVFLMNTLTDAQLIVSSDVAALLDRHRAGDATLDELDAESRQSIQTLVENGFLVADSAADRGALDDFFARVSNDRSELHVTVLTTMQCNFACDYCFQGDHGDYNKFADKMSLETAARVSAW